MVRGTEVHDGLKFQEKYLQRESAKKIFFSVWKILESWFLHSHYLQYWRCNNSSNVKGTKVYDDPKFQEKYFTYGSAKKICTGKISCFLRDLQWRIKNSIKKQMHKSNNSRTVKGTEVYDGLKFQEKYFTYGSAKRNSPGKFLSLSPMKNQKQH